MVCQQYVHLDKGKISFVAVCCKEKYFFCALAKNSPQDCFLNARLRVPVGAAGYNIKTEYPIGVFCFYMVRQQGLEPRTDRL